jgi:hypothetical protein
VELAGAHGHCEAAIGFGLVFFDAEAIGVDAGLAGRAQCRCELRRIEGWRHVGLLGVGDHVSRRAGGGVGEEDAAVGQILRCADRVVDQAADVVGGPALGVGVVLRGELLLGGRSGDGKYEQRGWKN